MCVIWGQFKLQAGVFGVAGTGAGTGAHLPHRSVSKVSGAPAVEGRAPEAGLRVEHAGPHEELPAPLCRTSAGLWRPPAVLIPGLDAAANTHR